MTRRSWWGRRSLHGRLALLSALAVTLAIAGVSAVTYLTTARTMRAQVDATLAPLDAVASAGQQIRDATPEAQAPAPAAPQPELWCERVASAPPAMETILGHTQLLRADGTTCSAGELHVVPTAEDVAVADGRAQGVPRDAVATDGTHVRVQTSQVLDGYAVMFARDLTELDATLARLRLILSVLTGAGALLAGAAGLLVARAGLRPVEGLTRAAERVATTGHLHEPIPVHGQDAVARLGRTFNAMISALAAARERQQQLIADASHELRTPLSSLRTNIELLIRVERSGRTLPADEHAALLESVTAQLGELGDLITELTYLAHDDVARPVGPVRLDDVVRRAAERAGRRGDHDLRLDLEPWEVRGDGADLERAVLNVLDNAVKFAPPRSAITVTLRDGVVCVADQGPGIPADERSHVLERFWRSPTARSTPGSGLGLAVVADVVGRHGGAVTVDDAPDGGAAIRLTFPGHRSRGD